MKLLILCLLFINNAYSAPGKRCNKASDCQDRLWCNGTETCSTSTDGKKRCKSSRRQRCIAGSGMTCNESAKKCVKSFCQTDADCSDGIWCNGQSSCMPSSFPLGFNGATKVWGCSPQTPVCGVGFRCDEAADQCLDINCLNGKDDADHDGAKSIACGGNDCDDNDSMRRPGIPEVCDVAGKDEDCNYETFGKRDTDGDGFIDAKCCQKRADGSSLCGTDCNDLDALIYPGIQTCLKHKGPRVNVCGYGPTRCDVGLVCYNQPNHSGICAPATP